MEVPVRKILRKEKTKKADKTPERPRRARPEAVLINLGERLSYAAILKDLKKCVKPDELGLTVQGIRETCSKDLLVELKCFKEGRGQLVTVFKEC